MRDLVRSFSSWIISGNPGGACGEPPGAWNASEYQERFQVAGGDGTLNFVLETAEGSHSQTPAIRVEFRLQTFVKLDVPPKSRGRPSCSLTLPAPPGRIICVQELKDDGHFSFATPVCGPGDMLPCLEKKITSFVGVARESARAQGRVVTRVAAAFEYVKAMPLAAVEQLAERAAEETMRGEIEVAEAAEEYCAACFKEFRREEWLRTVALGCGHVFHVGCIYGWLCKERSCALCRSKKLPRSEAPADKDAAIGRVAWCNGGLQQIDWKVGAADGDDDDDDERPKGLRPPFGFCGGSNCASPQDHD